MNKKILYENLRDWMRVLIPPAVMAVIIGALIDMRKGTEDEFFDRWLILFIALGIFWFIGLAIGTRGWPYDPKERK